MNRKTSRAAVKENEYLPVSHPRVLVVDDDAPMLEVLNEMLQEWSFAPTLAANFREARDAVLTGAPFAVIISDYHLPDGNGLELLDWLRREMLVQVPFLLISGGMTRLPSVVNDYEFLAKPFRMQELRSRLENLSRLSLEPAETFRLSTAQAAMASVYARRRSPKDK